MNNKMLQAAEQFRRVLQLFAMSLTDDEAMEIASVYESWEPNKVYAANTFLRYGENGVGDPQLYKVSQEHTAVVEATPDKTSSLYTPIGLTPEGYTKWSVPAGTHDTYDLDDIVDYNGVLYRSITENNISIPGTDNSWEKIN